MNGADFVILTLLAISSLVGLFRGLVKEVLSLVNWILALAVAFLFKSQVAQVLPFSESVGPVVRELVASAVLFFSTLLIGAVLAHALAQLVKATGLTGTDRTLGLCFGLARGLVIVMAGLIFLPALMPVVEADWWSESKLIPGFLHFESWTRDLISAIFEWIASIFN